MTNVRIEYGLNFIPVSSDVPVVDSCCLTWLLGWVDWDSVSPYWDADVSRFVQSVTVNKSVTCYLCGDVDDSGSSEARELTVTLR